MIAARLLLCLVALSPAPGAAAMGGGYQPPVFVAPSAPHAPGIVAPNIPVSRPHSGGSGGGARPNVLFGAPVPTQIGPNCQVFPNLPQCSSGSGGG